MKKITLVIFAFLLSFMGFAQFGPEGFEGTWTTGSGPAGWTIINAAGPIQTWQQQTSNATFPAHSANSAAFINRENVANGTVSDDWLITPAFTVPSNAQLNFWSRLTIDGDQNTVYKVLIGTDPANTASFTELTNWTELTLNTVQTEYQLKQVSIPSTYSGQSLYIAFVMQGDNGDRWLIDDVSVVAQCFDPTTLGVTNVTGDSATLTWTDVAGSGAWEVELLLSTQTPTQTGTLVTGATPAYPVTGLQPSTAYQFYVRSKCQPDGNNSAWVGPFSFTTTQIPATLNWNTDFESANVGFTLVNGTQTNQWFIGTAVSNSPTRSLYISNNGGVANQYNTSNGSVVHAYRDILIPAGAVTMAVSYDWRNQGETGWDYIRLWSTPGSYTPVAGTQTTAVNANYINHSGNLVGNANWSTNTHLVDVSAYAGTVRRFIFEWRNDTSGGTNPPAAIDNVAFTLVTCPQPTALTTTAINMTSAQLAWTEPGAATQWEVYVVPAAGAAPTASTTGTVVNGTPTFLAQGLTAGTAYKYYVRSICSGTDISLWSGPFNFNTNLCDAVDQCSYTFNLVDSFGDGWNGNTMAVQQNGVTIATLSLASGSAATQTVTVCNNNPITLFWNTGGNFATEVGVSIVNNFGQVLYTRTPGTGAQNTVLYTGAVDCANPACLAPTGLTATNIGQDQVTLTWGTAATGNWEYYVVPSTSPAPTDATPGIATTTNTVLVTGLNPSTSYNYYVRMICNGGASQSPWTPAFNFTTTQIPANLNYSEDFEGPLNWTLVNGTQTNQWFYGTAVSNSPTHSLYVTNNAGVSNAYTTSSSSVVHAYRDVLIPAGAVTMAVNYDWRNQGETGWDYVRLWSTPVTYSPVAGTQTTAVNANYVNHSGNLVGNANWTTNTHLVDVSAYAGTVRRFIFEWRNDGGGGTNPPGAVDNVAFTLITCPQPTNIQVANITDTSADITWAEAGTATQWEVYVVPATDPAPTAATVGTLVTGTPTYSATSLTSGTIYKVYVRSVCSATDKSFWTGPTNFNTPICSPTNQCNYTFVLTDSFGDGWNGNTMSVRQNGIVVGTLNLPSGSGPLSVQVPLCAGVPFDLFWNTGGSFATEVGVSITNPFGDTLYTHAPGTGAAGTVLFTNTADCTAPPCPRPTGLTMNCLSSDGFNISWTDPGNIAQWEVAVQAASSPAPTSGTVVTVPNYTYESPLTPGTAYVVYVRTVCPDGSGFSTWTTLNLTGPAVSVGDAQALCAGILAVPQQSNSGGTVPPYGTVGCLFSTPNPTWYYVTLGGDGAVSLNLSQTSDATGAGIDVDFAIFGPFDSKLEACSLLGSPPNTAYMVDCSYSASSIEQIDFTGNTGDVFALLVTNFNGAPGHATITQTSGPNLSCDPTVELGPNKSLCATSSYNLTATVDNPGTPQVYTYTWLQDGNPYTPTVVNTTANTQTISVTDLGSHVYTVTVTMPVPTSATPVTDTVTIALSAPYTAPTYDVINVCSTTATGDANININYLGTLDPAQYSLVGVYTSIANANSNTGAIDVTQPYTTGSTTLYAVVTDTAMPTCKTIVPLQINVAQTSATLNYPATLCPTDAATPSGLVQTGGTPGVYTATPAGLTIDPATGVIDPATSTAGAYHIVYTIAATATCAEVIAPDDVEIISVPTTTISYGGPFCSDAGTVPVLISGTTGGVFTGDAGLVIDANGTIDIAASTFGPHTITYVPPVTGPCTEPAVPPVTIQIIEAPAATLSYAGTPYCSNGGTATPLLTTNYPGTYVANSPDLAIDPATGAIDLAASVAGVYTVNYVIPASGPCGEFRTPDTTVTIVAAPDPATVIAYSAANYCSDAGAIAAPQITGTTGGTFTATPAGLDIDPATGAINTLTSTAGVTYAITYAVPATAPCVGFNAPAVNVTITPLPVATVTYGASAFCSNGGSILPTLGGSNNAGGTYTASNGLIINPVSGEIDLGVNAAGTYDVTYTVPASGGCPAVASAPVTITITTLPVAEFTYPVMDRCNAAGTAAIDPVMATGAVKGTFTVDHAGLSINSTSGVIDPSASQPGVYVVTNTVLGTDGCAGQTVTSTPITITITNAPVADFTYSAAAYCKASTTTVAANLAGAAGQFTSTPAGLVINASTGAIDVANSQPGVYSVTNTIAATADCGQIVSAPVNVIITAQPVITTTQGCVDNHYQLQVVMDTDPVYSVDNVDITWTYTNANGGTDTVGTEDTVIVTNPGEYVVTVSPRSGATCSATLPLTVVSTMCNVQRGISPDGSDGMNDNFVLTGLDVRKLVIFNRYGKEVYKFEGQYTDQWHGQTSSNEDLPTGTYFYTFVRSNGENRTGWIYVNRGVK